MEAGGKHDKGKKQVRSDEHVVECRLQTWMMNVLPKSRAPYLVQPLVGRQ